MALNKKNNGVTIDNEISRTSVNIIHITEDKLENILIRHITHLKKSRDWISAVALSITLFGTLFTVKFNEYLGIPGATIKGIFVTLSIASLFYLGYVLLNCFKYNFKVEDILDAIKDKKID